MQFSSYLTSLLLHGIVFLILLFLPASKYVPPRPQTALKISMSMGAPGGDNLPVPVLGHEGGASEAIEKPGLPQQVEEVVPLEKPDLNQPQQAQQPIASKQPIPPTPQAVPLEERPKEMTKPKEQVKPVEKPEAKPVLKPDKKTEPKKPEAKKPEPKPEPKKVEKKQQPKTTVKQTDKKPDKAKTQVKKPSEQDVLKALNDARKTAGKKGSSSGSSSSVSSALNDLRRQGGGTGGGGGQGSGPGGGGLYDVYMGQVILAIRPNWKVAVFTRQNMVVDIWIKISPTGEVLDCRVDRSSGRAEIDGSALNAVRRTKKLPPPLRPDQQELIVSFNTQDAL